MTRKWWQEAIGYQIYIRSFYDSNNDGIGDIQGIIRKLPYLADLGVNLLWISPFYVSPGDDNGYDVVDYYDVAKEYGTLEDVDELIAKAHALGIRIIADLILNHTSDAHKWFIESRKSLNNPYRKYYIWRKGRMKGGKRVEPTNWASFFGGSCWHYDPATGEYYMKIFSDRMPDLNWKSPKVQKEIARIASWWCDRGLDGFRIDAVSHLAKARFRDSEKFPSETYQPDWSRFSNLPKVHDYLRRLNRKSFSRYDIVTVGEAGGGATPEDAVMFTNPKRHELDMIFNFDHNWCNNAWDVADAKDLVTDVVRLKATFEKWQTGLYGKGWNALYWLNHDHPRLATHYGNPSYPKESAKMLATAMYLMWGTPFIYNGEEIGMTNPEFKGVDDFRDAPTIARYHEFITSKHISPDEALKKLSLSTRDNARCIMSWENAENAGFSRVRPWAITGDYRKNNVADEEPDLDSVLSYYKKLISLRKNSPYRDIIIDGTYEQIYRAHLQIYGYIRKYRNQSLLVLCNFSNETVNIDDCPYSIRKIVLSNHQRSTFTKELLPYESVVLEIHSEETLKHES